MVIVTVKLELYSITKIVFIDIDNALSILDLIEIDWIKIKLLDTINPTDFKTCRVCWC